jgi:hypothetical protein
MSICNDITTELSPRLDSIILHMRRLVLELMHCWQNYEAPLLGYLGPHAERKGAARLSKYRLFSLYSRQSSCSKRDVTVVPDKKIV